MRADLDDKATVDVSLARLRPIVRALAALARRIGRFVLLLLAVGLIAGGIGAGAHWLGFQTSTAKLLRMLLLLGYAGVAVFFVARKAR
ncbi:hypothetical protein [Rhodovibrio salinarum]|uniref:Transmembrane protein n=1 Tax=Rhodovibrio salinarum TaxID=1087 RepID=A0A934V0Q1_9PROT|nr:hypothetical protein [Rhodovibrio salinarum]MBK1698173.1 hypothetical protein [Rhodovibrio salinarum]